MFRNDLEMFRNDLNEQNSRVPQDEAVCRKWILGVQKCYNFFNYFKIKFHCDCASFKIFQKYLFFIFLIFQKYFIFYCNYYLPVLDGCQFVFLNKQYLPVLFGFETINNFPQKTNLQSSLSIHPFAINQSFALFIYLNI